MTKLSRITFFTLLGIFAVLSIHAQKFGYINSAQLLVEMPEIKAADTKIESFHQGLMTAGQDMVKKFEKKYNKYMSDANAGVLSQIQMQEREADLQQEQQAIQQYEYKVQQDVVAKREELYKPILDKVKNAIEAFGKENGYTMIFDTSTGSILHADDADNVMAEIKQKLGI